MLQSLPKDKDVFYEIIESKTVDAFLSEADADKYLWDNLGKKTGLKFRKQLYREIA